MRGDGAYYKRWHCDAAEGSPRAVPRRKLIVPGMAPKAHDVADHVGRHARPDALPGYGRELLRLVARVRVDAAGARWRQSTVVTERG